jgi:Kef-type K+ transport system membrane component KefB
MTIIYILLVLLIVTRVFGEIAERLGQPALLGELVSGIFLGLLVHHYDQTFPILAGLTQNEVFTSITDLGIFFLMLLGGMELQPVKLLKATKGALVVAAGGMLIPLALGFGLAYWLLPDSNFLPAQALFIATVMAITAVPVSIKALMDLGKLESNVGQTIVSAAVIDDILSLILLAVLTGFMKTGAMPDGISLLLLIGKVLLFFIIAGGLGYYLFPRIGKLLRKSHAEEFEFSMLLVAGLALAVLAEKLGLHFILGAFFAGLFFGRQTIDKESYESVMQQVSGLTTGFLAPIFFASIGLHLDLSALWEIPGFVALLILIACVGKIFGAGICARFTGMNTQESFAVGIGMNGRGAVELIIADIALRAGILSQPVPIPPIINYMFSAVVIMAVVTTLMTPPILKVTLNK